MDRWILLLLTFCLLFAPAASAEGHEPNGNAYGYEHHHDEEGEADEANVTDEEESSDEQNSTSTSDSSDPAPIQQDRCILYEWAGGVEDARISVNPILGILVLSPMDCVEEVVDAEQLLGV